MPFYRGQWFYGRDEVIELLPGVWDSGRVLDRSDPHKPDPDMPRSPYIPPHLASEKWAEVADVQRAWAQAPITDAERKAMLLRWGLEHTIREGAVVMGVSPSWFRVLSDSGVNALHAYLNGGDDGPRPPDHDPLGWLSEAVVPPV